jgi:hypothetical protein
MKTSVPTSIRAIEILGIIGIAFWIVIIIRGLLEGAGHTFTTLVVGLMLGGAHAVVALGARRQSVAYVYAIGFIFVGDSILAIFVDVRALTLVAFTLVLAALAASNSARRWLRSTSHST